jgi:hypothetical protein
MLEMMRKRAAEERPEAGSGESKDLGRAPQAPAPPATVVRGTSS